MKYLFILAAICSTVFTVIGQGAIGIVAGLFMLLLGAFFSKPRFKSSWRD